MEFTAGSKFPKGAFAVHRLGASNWVRSCLKAAPVSTKLQIASITLFATQEVTRTCTKAPGVGGGWAAGQWVDQQSTGLAPTWEGDQKELEIDTTSAWAGTVRALNEAVLAALERRDIDEARAAARALAEVLAGVAPQDG